MLYVVRFRLNPWNPLSKHLLCNCTLYRKADYAHPKVMAEKSPSPLRSATKRLLHELRFQSQNSAPHVLSLGPASDEQLLSWEAIMKGVPNTAYEAGLWKLSIKIPESYPLTPPNVNFDTTICHPNIQFKACFLTSDCKEFC